MRFLTEAWRRLRESIWRSRFERELREELDDYLRRSEDAHRARGCDTQEARRRARIELGGLESTREELRGGRTGAGVETVLRDARFAVRWMARQPGFTAVAVLTLGLGMGGTTAVATVARSVLLAPLPFTDADSLVRLRILATDATGRQQQLSLSPVFLDAVRSRSRLLEQSAAQRFQDVTLTGSGEPLRLIGTAVSDGWAETLGVNPVAGRRFSEAEQREGEAARVAIIGYGLWQRQFGGSSDAVGRAIRLDDRVYTIVGVMPPQFRYPYNSEIWFPATLPAGGRQPSDLNVPARMRPGVTVDRLNVELAGILTDLIRTEGVQSAGERLQLVGVPMREEFVRDPNRSIAVMAIAVVFVLLLTSVNLATLLVARGGARAHEMAVRAALGAGRGRLVRQQLIESVLLATAGGVLGVAVALGVRSSLALLIPPRLGEVIQHVDLDGAVVLAASLVCVVTGMLFGLVPAWRLAGARPVGALRHSARAGTGGRRALDTLVVIELALATVLVVGAGLMTQHVIRLLSADVGYDPAGLVRIHVGLADSRYGDPSRRTIALQQILERVRGVPGVVAAGVTSLQPVPRVGRNLGTSVMTPGLDQGTPFPLFNRRLVLPGYFNAMRMRVLAGRDFADSDGTQSEPVVIINEAAAKRFWPDRSPIGLQLKPLATSPSAEWHRIVGVVSDIAEPNSDEMPATVYQPYAQATSTLPPGAWTTTSVAMMVRLGNARIEDVYGAVWAVDPSVPLFETAPMATVLEAPLGDQRFGATVFAAFGLFSVLLAVLGTYGVLAFAVSRRMREFGLRLALGARPASLLSLVVGMGARLAALGLALGLIGAFMASRLLATLVEGVAASDLKIFALGAAALGAAAVAASLPAALRAMRADPIRILRDDA